ncbi:MAG: THUMP domain-containing protein [Lentisphaeria bacterium]|nr:MAG: THUMP domain-containing protein [Lentisphaeria bacterium]
MNRVDGEAFSAAEMEAIRPQLAKAFGLESFSPAVRLPVDMDAIREAAVAMAPEVLGAALAERENVTFRVRARRSNKRFPFRSQEIEIDLVSAIAERLGNGASSSIWTMRNSPSGAKCATSSRRSSGTPCRRPAACRSGAIRGC